MARVSPKTKFEKAFANYDKAMRTIRGAFAARTMGSDFRMASRAMRVAQASVKLSAACEMLNSFGDDD